MRCLGFLVFAAGLVLSCVVNDDDGDSESAECTPGELRCSCDARDACDVGLSCFSGICVREGTTGAGGDDGDSGGGLGSAPRAGRSSGTGGATGSGESGAPSRPDGGVNGEGNAPGAGGEDPSGGGSDSRGGTASGQGGSAGTPSGGKGGTGNGGQLGTGGSTDPGPGGAGSSEACVGEATPCENLSLDECADAVGCEEGGGCRGLPDCEDYDAVDCEDVEGCTLDGALCVGEQGFCQTLTDREACEDFSCDWSLGCKGEETDCGVLGQEDCATRPGCGWGSVVPGGSCVGEADACEFVEENCANSGCDDESGCGGVELDCDEHNSESACESAEGCDWENVEEYCYGFPTPCDDFFEGECDAQPGCNWQTQCTGSPSACSQHDDENECEMQSGCSWQ
jgi:hypothetical protein